MSLNDPLLAKSSVSPSYRQQQWTVETAGYANLTPAESTCSK